MGFGVCPTFVIARAELIISTMQVIKYKAIVTVTIM